MADTKVSGLVAAAAALTTHELPVNEAGTSKKVTGSQLRALAWAMNGASAYQATQQLMPATGVLAVLKYDTIVDTDGNYDVTANKGRYTATVAGKYLVMGGFAVVTTNTTLGLMLYKNGVAFKQLSFHVNTYAGAYCYGSGRIKLAIGDYIELAGQQGAAAQNTNATQLLTWMDVQFMGT